MYFTSQSSALPLSTHVFSGRFLTTKKMVSTPLNTSWAFAAFILFSWISSTAQLLSSNGSLLRQVLSKPLFLLPLSFCFRYHFQCCLLPSLPLSTVFIFIRLIQWWRVFWKVWLRRLVSESIFEFSVWGSMWGGGEAFGYQTGEEETPWGTLDRRGHFLSLLQKGLLVGLQDMWQQIWQVLVLRVTIKMALCFQEVRECIFCSVLYLWTGSYLLDTHGEERVLCRKFWRFYQKICARSCNVAAQSTWKAALLPYVDVPWILRVKGAGGSARLWMWYACGIRCLAGDDGV